jgi:hypothetical protein
VAGLIGQEIVNQEGQYLGTVVDLIFRWDTKEPYPRLAGMIVKVSRRQVRVTADDIKHLAATKGELATATMDLREFKACGCSHSNFVTHHCRHDCHQLALAGRRISWLAWAG